MFQDEDELLASLLHGNARLEFVLAQYLEAYAAVLKTAKAAKVETAMNRVSSSGRKNKPSFCFSRQTHVIMLLSVFDLLL